MFSKLHHNSDQATHGGLESIGAHEQEPFITSYNNLLICFMFVDLVFGPTVDIDIHTPEFRGIMAVVEA